MGTSNPDNQIIGPPSKIGENVTLLDHYVVYVEMHLDPACRHGDTLLLWLYFADCSPSSPPLSFFWPLLDRNTLTFTPPCYAFALVLFDGQIFIFYTFDLAKCEASATSLNGIIILIVDNWKKIGHCVFTFHLNLKYYYGHIWYQIILLWIGLLSQMTGVCSGKSAGQDKEGLNLNNSRRGRKHPLPNRRINNKGKLSEKYNTGNIEPVSLTY